MNNVEAKYLMACLTHKVAALDASGAGLVLPKETLSRAHPYTDEDHNGKLHVHCIYTYTVRDV